MRTGNRSSGVLALGVAIAWAASGEDARAQARRLTGPIPDGVEVVRGLGGRARAALSSPRSPALGCLVRLKPGMRAGDLGLYEVAPGIARLWGSPADVLAFGDAHPDVAVEVTPPLHLLLNTAGPIVGADVAAAEGLDGTGVAMGIVDTGIDLTHPDFIDAAGHTRVAWYLDLTQPPMGRYTDLEKSFGLQDSSGNTAYGAVWSAADINLAMASGQPPLPQDVIGHGTLVAACAAGSGAGGTTPYRGTAPRATLIVVNVLGGSSTIDSLPLLNGVNFAFDRAANLGLPSVVNLSIGGDFGPHDGTLAWEQALASTVGPGQPGRALVVAAGNSGSIVDAQVHQNVHVSAGSTMRVPIVTSGAGQAGGVEVWVAMHSTATLSVGLDGPDGTWIDPVAPDAVGNLHATDYDASIVNGSGPAQSPVPPTTHGATILWQGVWPPGTYYVTLVGTGTADLYVEGTGDAAIPGFSAVGFAYGVREGTVGLPATHPAILSVGCTISKTSWQSIDPSEAPLHVLAPLLDGPGAKPDPMQRYRYAVDGEPCWFSGAGPTLTGVFKPEILAPGAAIVGALSRDAPPSSINSIFNMSCPATRNGTANSTCQQVDSTHGVSYGTSFSSPLVAGAIAVLLQRDPTLTEDRIGAALQGGAHRLRHNADSADQAGAGELDVPGAVLAAQRWNSPEAVVPDRTLSWLTLGVSTALADGSTPIEALVELRGAQADGTPGPADVLAAGRLAVYARVDGRWTSSALCDQSEASTPTCTRRGPGLWGIQWPLPAGLGGSNFTLGVTLDGADIVDPESAPIATDAWNAAYAPSVQGSGCALSGVPTTSRCDGWALSAAVLGWVAGRRRNRNPARAYSLAPTPGSALGSRRR